MNLLEGIQTYLRGQTDSYKRPEHIQRKCITGCSYQCGVKFFGIFYGVMLCLVLIRSIIFGIYLQTGADHFLHDYQSVFKALDNSYKALDADEFNSVGTIGIYSCVEACSILPLLYGSFIYCYWSRNSSQEKVRARLPETHIITVLLNVLVSVVCFVYNKKNPLVFFFSGIMATVILTLNLMFFHCSREYVREYNCIEDEDEQLPTRVKHLIEQLWTDYDIDQNGHLDQVETRALVEQVLRNGEDLDEDQFQHLFEEFDADGSGTIEKDEMRDFILKLYGFGGDVNSTTPSQVSGESDPEQLAGFKKTDPVEYSDEGDQNHYEQLIIDHVIELTEQPGEPIQTKKIYEYGQN